MIDQIVPTDGEVIVEEHRIPVRPMEMAILILMAKNSPHFIRASEIEELSGKNTAKVYVNRMRTAGIPIENRRGYGYRIHLKENQYASS